MGIELLTEEQYRELQKFGEFDTKTSSWIRTPSQIRKLGGALFCDRRYDTFLWRATGRDGLQSGETPLVTQFEKGFESVQRYK